MEYDKELIKTRIENIKDPVQKVMLQDVLKDVFSTIMDYSEDCFKQLETRIDAELADANEKYYIYTGVCKKDEIDETGTFLYEVDTQKQNCCAGTLKTIFLACDFQTIQQCLNRTFSAEVETENHTYHLKAALKYSPKYLSKIEWLYQQFQANKRNWHTINCPYLYKFLDVVDVEQVVPMEETVRKVILDLGDLNKFMHTDMVLVWNVQELEVETTSDIIPGDKTVLYEHKVELPMVDAGYLASVEEPETFYTIYNEEALLIRSQNRSYESLNLLRIAGFNLEKENTKLAFPLQSNKRKMRHIDKQAGRQPKLVFTKGEMQRMLSSYEAYDSFRLKAITLSHPLFGNKCESAIDCNQFMPSHNFLDKRRVLTFSFGMKEKEDILLYEKMFFLISEMQLYTDEYQCAGNLRNFPE